MLFFNYIYICTRLIIESNDFFYLTTRVINYRLSQKDVESNFQHQ